MTVSQEFPLAGFPLSIPLASCPCRWIMSRIPQQVRQKLYANRSPISLAFFLWGCSSKLELNSGHSSARDSSASFQDWIKHLSTEGHIPAANTAQPTLFQALGLGSVHLCLESFAFIVFPWRASLVLVDVLETCERAVLKAVLAKLVNLWGDLLNCLNYWQDDPSAMDFVTSAANLRMHIFSMNMKSRFDIKCKLFVLQLYHLNSKFILLCFF